eukprot:TRINITY_DN9063_c0_g1_i1.p1 TRINITY_DN9063_c0_g1~~TRINITY_DN9063_c0_g1_i1.p1  ORF type:complete len:113 (+),score=16.22 TRINITY_DN9063_c0_g1_i1:151-489(+)
MTTGAKNFDKVPVSKFGMQSKKPIKIKAFKFAEMKDEGTDILLKNITKMEQLKKMLAEKLGLLPRLHPQKGIMTIEGVVIDDLSELQDGGRYVCMKAGQTFQKDKVPSAALQ